MFFLYSRAASETCLWSCPLLRWYIGIKKVMGFGDEEEGVASPQKLWVRAGLGGEW